MASYTNFVTLALVAAMLVFGSAIATGKASETPAPAPGGHYQHHHHLHHGHHHHHHGGHHHHAPAPAPAFPSGAYYAPAPAPMSAAPMGFSASYVVGLVSLFCSVVGYGVLFA